MSHTQPSPVVLITSPDPYKLQDMLDREKRRRALVVRSEVLELEPGLWGVQAVQLRRLERTWVKPVAVAGGAAGVLACSAAAGWFLLGAVTDVVTAAASVSSAAALGVLAVLVLVFRATRSGSSCTTTVTVKHHH